jgi:hypothetical protein
MTRRRNIVLLASALCLTLGFSRTASAQFCNNNTCGGTTEIGYSGTGYALQVATTDGIAIWAETLAGSVGIYGTGAGDGIEGVGQGGSGAGVWGGKLFGGNWRARWCPPTWSAVCHVPNGL